MKCSVLDVLNEVTAGYCSFPEQLKAEKHHGGAEAEAWDLGTPLLKYPP